VQSACSLRAGENVSDSEGYRIGLEIVVLPGATANNSQSIMKRGMLSRDTRRSLFAERGSQQE
jgi:hypothetical protein